MSDVVSTARLTEDVEGLQRKVVYRGSFPAVTDSGSLSSGAFDITVSVILPQLDVSTHTLSHEVYSVIGTGTGTITDIQVWHKNYNLNNGPALQDTVYSKITSTGGKLTLTVHHRTNSVYSSTQKLYIYYVIYSTKITDDQLF